MRGFTIAELLVAILITSIIAAIVYGSYMGGLRIIYDAREDMERTALGRHVLERIAADLSCAFLRADKAYLVFIGEDSEGDQPSDALTFIASDHVRTKRDAPESTLSEVSYFLDPVGGEDLYILHREDPTLDEDPFTGGDTRIIGEGVAGLDFEYYDGESWQSSWDSREENSLPRAVRVTLVFRTEEEGGGEEGEEAVRYTTFRTEVAVPLGGSWEEEEEEPTPTPNPKPQIPNPKQ
jgi:type II secretion system protein J